MHEIGFPHIDQSQVLELIDPLVSKADHGVPGALQIAGGLGRRATGREGGEVSLGTAAGVAGAFGYPGW